MNFKNIAVYRIRPEVLPDLTTMEAALREQPFAPCGATEPQRVGWAPALDDEATAYVHSTADTMLVRLRIQNRLLPPGVVNEQLNEQVRQLQDKEGRKLGKKEVARLKDELMFTLLPRAFTKTRDMLAILCPADGLVMVGATSLADAELLLNALRLALGTLPVRRPAFTAPLPAIFTAWLTGDRELPAGITLGDVAELVDEDSIAKVAGMEMTSTEIKAHLEAGKEARKLSLVFEDSLFLTVQGDARLAGIRLSERLQGDLDARYGGDKFENLAAEFELWQLSLRKLLGVLLPGLGETKE